MTTPTVTENAPRLTPVDRDTFCDPRPALVAPWPAPVRRPADA